MKNLKDINCVTFYYICENCGNQYNGPVFLGGYGQFLMHSIGGTEYAWLEATSNGGFKEVGEIIKQCDITSELSRNEQAKLHQKIVGYAFDVDSEGNHFTIGGQPLCPSCGSQRASRYGEISPREITSIEVKEVSSVFWESLSMNEKKDYIEQKINEYKP